MISMLITWVIVAVGILVAAHLIPGVKVSSFTDAFIAAIVLGLLNALVKPILVYLTLPISFLTLGLFLFVINALMFYLAGSVLSGFQVTSFLSALLGSLVVSAVSYLANSLR